MARRYYRRYRYRPRRYVRRWFKRRFRRYVNGSSRSISRIKTSFVSTTTVSAGFGTTAGDVYFTNPLGSATSPGALSNSQLYRTYCNLYEEIKILGVKVAVSVVTPVGDTTTPSLQLFTAWDRKRGYNEDAPNAADIVSASTYNVATALNNNVAKITRSCYASDLMEKAVWIDATLDPATGRNLAWVAAAEAVPCFHPSFMLTMVSPSLGAAHNVTVSVSFTYYLAFRNPKFGGGSSSSKVEDLGVRSVDLDGDVDVMSDAAAGIPELPPDEPGDFPEDSSLTPGAAVARANTAARREAESLRKRTHRTIIIDPTRGGTKNA